MLACFARIGAIGPLLIALSLPAGCGAPDAGDPPLRVVAVSAEVAADLAAENIGLGLTARDASGAVIPGLAQSWRVSDDGLSIVFRLRAATFSDGRPVTTADVLETLSLARRLASPAVRMLLAGTESVSAPLPDIVEMVLSTPQPELLELLAHPDLAIRPRGRGPLRAGPFVRATPPAGGAKGTAAAGPDILLERSDRFHDADAVAIGAAEIRTADAEVGIAGFRRGTADIVTGAMLEAIGSARVAGAADSLRMERTRAAYTLLVNQASGSLADRRVRQAMAMAIDRDRIGLQLFGTAALPDWQSLSLVQRREEALRLLAEAGHGPDNRLALTVSATSRATDEQLLSLVAADLAAVGVDLTLGRRAAARHEEAVARGEFDLALVLRASPIASPLPFLDPLRCDRNRHGVCLEEADALLAASWRAPTSAERAAMLASAERLWAEDGAAIGIVQPVRWSLVSRRISGWTPNVAGVHPFRFLVPAPERRLLK